MRHGRRLLALTAAAAALLVLAPAASAKIYWANMNTLPQQGRLVAGSIGSANTDGTGVNQQLVPERDDPCAVATDGRYVYWAQRDNGPNRHNGIYRAHLDGSPVDGKFRGDYGDFITGIQFHCGQIAVDANHIYWTQQDPSAPAIGRADIDGQHVDTQWLPVPQGGPMGMTIDAEHVYWTYQPSGSFKSTIARANLDGSGVQANFIPGAVAGGDPYFLAVDGAHIYAAPFFYGHILRANLDGTGVDPNFIEVPASTRSCGIAVDGAHIYWGAEGKRGNAVARANIDGTGVSPSFITGGQNTCGVAVGPDVAPTPGFTLGEVEKNKRRGTAILHADIEEAGKLVMKGEDLRTKIRAPLRPHEVKLRVQATGDKKEKLNRTGSVRVRARVTFHPSAGGDREVERQQIKLKKDVDG